MPYKDPAKRYEWNRNWRKANPEKVAASKRTWYLKNIKKVQEFNRLRWIKRKEENKALREADIERARAKRRETDRIRSQIRRDEKKEENRILREADLERAQKRRGPAT